MQHKSQLLGTKLIETTPTDINIVTQENKELRLNEVVLIPNNNLRGQITYINNLNKIIQLSPFMDQEKDNQKTIIDTPIVFKIPSIKKKQTAQDTTITNLNNNKFDFQPKTISLYQAITVKLTQLNEQQKPTTIEAITKIHWIYPEELWIECSPIEQ